MYFLNIAALEKHCPLKYGEAEKRMLLGLAWLSEGFLLREVIMSANCLVGVFFFKSK